MNKKAEGVCQLHCMLKKQCVGYDTCREVARIFGWKLYFSGV